MANTLNVRMLPRLAIATILVPCRTVGTSGPSLPRFYTTTARNHLFATGVGLWHWVVSFNLIYTTTSLTCRPLLTNGMVYTKYSSKSMPVLSYKL